MKQINEYQNYRHLENSMPKGAVVVDFTHTADEIEKAVISVVEWGRKCFYGVEGLGELETQKLRTMENRKVALRWMGQN